MESISSFELRQGEKVHFAIGSVFLPTVDDVLASLLPSDHLVGTIAQFSGSGTEEKAFAVIMLAGQTSLIIRVEKLSRIEGG